MPNAEFLRMVQLVDAIRAVVGRDTLQIDDLDVDKAQVMDDRAASHLADVGGDAHDCASCRDCTDIGFDRSMHRENLRLRGKDFSPEVFPITDSPQDTA